MGDVKKLAKSSLIYLIGNVLSKVMVFFMLPLYTQYISATDMGYYDTAIAIVQFVQSILFMDIGSTIMRFMFDRADSKPKSICTGIALFSLSLAVYCVAGVFTGIFSGVDNVWLLIAYGATLIFVEVNAYVTRGYGRNTHFALSGILATVVNIGMNLILILVVHMDYKSLYISLICANVVQALFLEAKNKNYKCLKPCNFDKQLFKVMLKYTLPLGINAVAFWGLTSLNRILVTALLGTEFTGYLAIANKFNSILYLFSTCFQLAWQEVAFSKKNTLDKETGAYYEKAFDLYQKVLLVGLVMLIPALKVFLSAFPTFISAQYAQSIYLIPLGLVGAIFSIESSFLGSVFTGLKKTGTIFFSTLAGAAVNAAIVVGLIYAGVGVMSANIGLICGFAACTLVRTIILKKFIGMRVRYWYYLIFAAAYAGVAYAFSALAWYYSLAIFIAVGIVVVVCCRKFIKKLFMRVKAGIKSKKASKSANADGTSVIDASTDDTNAVASSTDDTNAISATSDDTNALDATADNNDTADGNATADNNDTADGKGVVPSSDAKPNSDVENDGNL